MKHGNDKNRISFPPGIRNPELEVESPDPDLRGYMFEGRDGSQIVFWECERAVTVKPHTHEFDEYCLVVEGVCEESVEGQTTILKPGDEIIIPAGKEHWATMGPNYRAIDFFGGQRTRYKNW